MSRLKDEILRKAFEIGFNYVKQTYNPEASVSLPCSVYLKNGDFYENVVLVLAEKPLEESSRETLHIEDVEKITSSKYALTFEHRIASINAEEWRNDWPFFLRTKDNELLCFNAYEPINFTFRKDVLGIDIVETVSFDAAKKEGYKSGNYDLGPTIRYIYCGYDKELIEKIKKIPNSRIKTASI